METSALLDVCLTHTSSVQKQRVNFCEPNKKKKKKKISRTETGKNMKDKD